MRGRVCAILLLVMALGSAGIVSAQPTRRLAIIQLDPIKTRINFTLPGAVHATTGSFKLKHGEIRVDPETGGASGSIIVDAASASSGVAMRDSRMKNDILEVQRYPEISFAPRLAVGRPVPRGDFPMQVRGLFLLHGEPHNMMLDVAIRRKGDDFTAAASREGLVDAPADDACFLVRAGGVEGQALGQPGRRVLIPGIDGVLENQKPVRREK